MYISPKGKGRQPLATIFFMEAEKSNQFDHWLHAPKNILPSDFMHIFTDIIYVYSPVVAYNSLGPKSRCQQKGLITSVICCKFKISSTSDFIHIFS